MMQVMLMVLLHVVVLLLLWHVVLILLWVGLQLSVRTHLPVTSWKEFDWSFTTSSNSEDDRFDRMTC